MGVLRQLHGWRAECVRTNGRTNGRQLAPLGTFSPPLSSIVEREPGGTGRAQGPVPSRPLAVRERFQNDISGMKS